MIIFYKGSFPVIHYYVGPSCLCNLFNDIANLILSLTNGFELLGLILRDRDNYILISSPVNL